MATELHFWPGWVATLRARTKRESWIRAETSQSGPRPEEAPGGLCTRAISHRSRDLQPGAGSHEALPGRRAHHVGFRVAFEESP